MYSAVSSMELLVEDEEEVVKKKKKEEEETDTSSLLLLLPSRLESIQKQLDVIHNIVIQFDTKMDNMTNPSHYVRIQCENARKNSLMQSFDSDDEEEEEWYEAKRRSSPCAACLPYSCSSSSSSHCTIY
jgi:hypothetical protein